MVFWNKGHRLNITFSRLDDAYARLSPQYCIVDRYEASSAGNCELKTVCTECDRADLVREVPALIGELAGGSFPDLDYL
jgi:hypothetical protein